MKALLIFVFFNILISFSAFSQKAIAPNNAQHLLDSLITAHKIERCIKGEEGKFLWAANPYKFSFDKNFLVLQVEDNRGLTKAYYDMNKLVSFYIQRDRLVLKFQE